MTRLIYGQSPSDFTVDSSFRLVPGAELTVWDLSRNGTQIGSNDEFYA